MNPARLALFIDYQNVYRRCREAFGLDGADTTEGQVSPLKVGRLVASRAPNTRIERVFVYRGMPDGRRDAVGHAACRRQVTAWEAEGQAVQVCTRPLRYGRNGDVREKGIDVQLAIDCVRMALSREFDIVAIFSGDSDLAPAAEFIFDQFRSTNVRVNLVAWHGGPRINLTGGRKPGYYMLQRADYATVRDTRNYNRQT